ncbi:MAG: hypothetical protein EXS35_15710 [Pedosphaera sp.]|nr:hypothetical protein [Pedosphaera sp.]
MVQPYSDGDLLKALASWPENHTPSSDQEKTFHAVLLLSVGQADAAAKEIEGLKSPAANAIRELIAVVKRQKISPLAQPTTASEWLARSYTFQSESKLSEALKAAREATAKSPNFGFAWVRVAELEFSFGHTAAALDALDKGLSASPATRKGWR